MRLSAIPLAITAVVGLSPLVVGESDASVEYAYSGASSLGGRISGTCDSSGIDYQAFTGGVLEIESNGGALELRTTHVNYTKINGNTIDDGGKLNESSRDVPPGKVRVEWNTKGIATVFRAFESDDPIDVRFDVDRANTSAAEYSPKSPHSYWEKHPDSGNVALARGVFPGWGRRVTFDQSVEASGNVSILLHEARILLPEGTVVEMEPFRTEEKLVDTEHLSIYHVRFEDAFLNLQRARFSVGGQPQIICGELSARTIGELAASGASGVARFGDQTIEFDERVLTLQGSFDLREALANDGPSLEAGEVRGTADGQVRALGIDFANVPIRGKGSSLGVPESLGAVGLLLAIWYGVVNAGKFVGAFFARFGREKVLENSTRRAIYELVSGDPGVSLTEISARLSVRRDLAKFHLRVLERTEMLKLIRVPRGGRPWLIAVPRGLSPQEERTLTNRFVLSSDPKLAHVWGVVQTSPTRMNELVKDLLARFGLSRRGAEKVIARGEHLGILERLHTGNGRGDVIRCA